MVRRGAHKGLAQAVGPQRDLSFTSLVRQSPADPRCGCDLAFQRGNAAPVTLIQTVLADEDGQRVERPAREALVWSASAEVLQFGSNALLVPTVSP